MGAPASLHWQVGCGVARGACAAHLPGRRQPQHVRMNGDGGHMRQQHMDRQHIDLGVLAMSGGWDWLAT